jgi:hypothetical protein
VTSDGLGEMFEGDSADMCAGKFPLLSMGGRAEGLACADPGARTPSVLAEIASFIGLFLQYVNQAVSELGQGSNEIVHRLT